MVVDLASGNPTPHRTKTSAVLAAIAGGCLGVGFVVLALAAIGVAIVGLSGVAARIASGGNAVPTVEPVVLAVLAPALAMAALALLALGVAAWRRLR